MLDFNGARPLPPHDKPDGGSAVADPFADIPDGIVPMPIARTEAAQDGDRAASPQEPSRFVESGAVTPESDPGGLNAVADDAFPFTSKPLRFPRAKDLERRRWFYGFDYIAGALSATISPGGVGKSTLVLSEAVAMATGQDILGKPVREGPQKVALWNLEDPPEEVARRAYAVAASHGLTTEDLGGRLHILTGQGRGLELARMDGGGAALTLDVPRLEAFIRAGGFSVVILDPFVSTHAVPENDNGAMDRVAKALNGIAQRTGCALHVVHHVAKLRGEGIALDSARGASAFVDATRGVRGLAHMSGKEAEAAGLDTPAGIFRAVDLKASYAAPEAADWYRLAPVTIPDGEAMGQTVAAVERWTWPDAFADVTDDDVRRIADRLDAMPECRASSQASGWAGYAVGDAMGWDMADPVRAATVKRMLRTWEASGLVEVVKRKVRNGNESPFYVVNRSRLPGPCDGAGA